MLYLPLPLLLLIHVHLLGYPHADDPEYDEHVFNVKTRGLRDRTKTMEDLSYFLVGKIEHKPRLKSLFPTYPCLQPSDSVAFRAVLAKYLEGLRNLVVRPETHSKVQGTSSKGKSPGPSTAPDPWWWKDVVVRKSLLEECTGNRFERMIIALSTHALFANTSESVNAIASDPSAATSLLPTLPKAHVSLEATIRDARRAWERSITLLQQRQADLKHLGSSTVAICDPESKAMHADLSVAELVSLCESKRDLLRRGGWQGELGCLSLDFVVALAGFSWPELPAADTGHANESYLSPEKISTNEDLLPPLPTAAAHHPQHMESFASPVMSTSSVTADRRPPQTSDCGQRRNSTTRTRRVNVLITERLAAEQQTGLAFKEALNRMHIMRESLQAQSDLIPIADGPSSRVQSGIPSDVPVPPAPSKDVITDALTLDKAARFPAQSQATRPGKASSVHLAAFPLPKTSRARNQPPRPRVVAIPTVGSARSTRPLKRDNAKHHSHKLARPTEPTTTTLISKSSGAENNEAVAQEASGNYQSSSEVREITTTTHERKATIIINFDEDEAFLPSDLKPNIKLPAPPKYDFIEDNSAFFPSFLKRDTVQSDPARREGQPACASLASSRESTPGHGTTTLPMADGEDEDDWTYEGKSMTLRDILVRAGDATFAHFDILNEDVVDVADETLGWE